MPSAVLPTLLANRFAKIATDASFSLSQGKRSSYKAMSVPGVSPSAVLPSHAMNAAQKPAPQSPGPTKGQSR